MHRGCDKSPLLVNDNFQIHEIAILGVNTKRTCEAIFMVI